MADIEQKAAELTYNFETLVLKFMQYIHRNRERTGGAYLELSTQQRKLIQTLARYGPCTMHATADYMMLAVSTMSGIMNKLVKMGIVRREHSERDRRVVQVSLTEKGFNIYSIDVEEHIRFNRKILACLNDEEQSTYLSLTKRIVDHLEAGPRL